MDSSQYNKILINIKGVIKLTLNSIPDYYEKNKIDEHIKALVPYITDEKIINRLVQDLEESFVETPEPTVISIHKPGWVKRSFISGSYDEGLWERYSDYLSSNNRSFNVVSLGNITDKILNYIHDPNEKGSWSRRGMVVGHVQSGKTSNYIGIANKAIGHGYKLVIILTGMYDDLRVQTQERIDYGIIGTLSADTAEKHRGDKVGVGNFNNITTVTSIQSLTSILSSKMGGDFNDSSAPNVHLGKGSKITYILAIKKNKSILESVIRWLNSFSETDTAWFKKVKNLPTLIIDDEADSASVNSSKIDEDPKTINKLIRVMINMLNQVSFVGYTATPYANIFIDSRDSERETYLNGEKYDISKDLFPEDFIINLKQSPNYFGPDKIFGLYNNIPLAKTLESFNDNYRSIFPASIKTGTIMPDELPESIKETIIHYFLVAIIREKRDGVKTHNSMLIHVSLRVAWIDKIAYLTEKYISSIKKKFISDNSEAKSLVFKIFNDIQKISKKVNKLNYQFDMDPFENFEAVWSELINTINYTEVVAVHGGFGSSHGIQKHENTTFEYGEIPRYYILVGGNRLSRGITLEGLTTSYFVRVSKMYDSLMQMGRWFGYRGNYMDLCRLYTSQELIKWYGFITQATEELREEFDLLDYKITPKNYALKVQKSPDQLKITSLGRMRNSKVVQFSYNGKFSASLKFEDKPEVHVSNFDKLIKNLESIQIKPFIESDKTSKIYWKNVPVELVSRLLRDFKVHPDLDDGHKLTISFIEDNAENFSNGINIVLPNIFKKNDSIPSKVFLNIHGEKKINIVGRQRMPKTGEGLEDFVLNKDGLTDSSDKYYDMKIDYGINSITEGEKKRTETNIPILLLYIINGKLSLNRKDISEFDKFKINDENVLIPAYYIKFPKHSEDNYKAVDYVVNLVDSNLEYQESDED